MIKRVLKTGGWFGFAVLMGFAGYGLYSYLHFSSDTKQRIAEFNRNS